MILFYSVYNRQCILYCTRKENLEKHEFIVNLYSADENEHLPKYYSLVLRVRKT